MIARLINALRRKRTYRYRSAITGKLVSKAVADANPATTVRERVK